MKKPKTRITTNKKIRIATNYSRTFVINSWSFVLIKTIIILLSISLIIISPALAQEDNQQIDIGGYYKNLVTTSKTTSAAEEFISCLQRVRLELKRKFTDELSCVLMYDNEVLLNDFSDTPEFDIIRQKNQRNLALLDADHVLSDEEHFYWKHGIYRAYIQYYTPELQCTLGKQAIDWSRTRFYHPFDLFNPISPLDIEGDEKFGVDAINVAFSPEGYGTLNAIYAPGRESDEQAYGLRFLTKTGDYDIFFMGSEVKKDTILGCGFDGYIKEAGFRGECALTFDDDGDNYFRGVIGLDYSFNSKLYGIAEYFYNGGGVLSIKKHIIGAGLEYEPSGITKLKNYVFYDIEESSIFYNPEFKWNFRQNADVSFGAQLFEGDNASEFGAYHNLYYAELKLFF